MLQELLDALAVELLTIPVPESSLRLHHFSSRLDGKLRTFFEDPGR
jgi:hypothetical protein